LGIYTDDYCANDCVKLERRRCWS